MAECIAEDELYDLVHARRRLADAPAIEAHLADCAACSALLSTLLEPQRDDGDGARGELVGATLGPYRLDGLIGAGAMGEVYRGWDGRLHRHVAVKVLSRRFAESPDRVRRLEAEGRAAAAIAHPNVVTVYDTGTHDGVSYVVSELITGESLRSAIDRGAIARRRALELGLQLARGLTAAHAQGVIHRDLKPGNLIVTEDGTLKILDFGLAKVTTGGDVEATEPGTLLGTSGYLSPEQARGEPADARSDLFAVGAILYELLSGRRAFGGATFAERLSAVLRDTPPALDDAANAIVMRCLDKDPRKRFQSANDLAWVLEPLLATDAPPPRRPRAISRRLFLAGTAAAAAGGVLIGRALRPAPARAFVPEYRQLTFRQGRVASARFTRDAGSLIYSAAWDDQALAVFTARLGGGGTRPLAVPSAQVLAVSSRGELALSLDHLAVDGFHRRGRLALVPLEGGTPQELGIEVQHADFTPDGERLAVVRRAGVGFRLELPVGQVLHEAGWISHPRVSPRGDAIACCVHDGPFDDRGDLVLIPVGGGPARTIAADWSSIDGVAWTPSGRAIWVSASREGGNNSLHAIALDGRELAHIPTAGRLRVLDVAADGRLAVTHSSGRMRMMVRAPGAADEVDLSQSDIAMVADLSADGRYVAVAEFGDVDTASGAYVRPTDGGPPLRLGLGDPLDLADDGRGVLVRFWDKPRVAIVPLPAGEQRTVEFPGLATLRWARWCHRDRIVVAGSMHGRPARLWRRDPDGTMTALTDEHVVGRPITSPDGGSLAFAHADAILIVDVDGRAPPRRLPGSFVDRLPCGWSADGTELYVRTKSPPLIRVDRVAIATGATAPLHAIRPPPLGLRGVDAVYATADAYAYSYGQELSRLYAMTAEDPGG